MGCFIFGGGGKKADGDNLNFSQVNMEPQFGLAGKKFYNKNKELKAGTILNWDGTPLTLLDGDTVPGADVVEPSLSRRYIPSGKYLGKPVELAPMPQGSITGAQLDNHTFRITKTAGYIEGGTIDIAIQASSYLIGAADHNYTINTAFYYIDPADPDFSDDLHKTFLACLFAHGSVSSGEIAAISIAKQEDLSWAAMAYVSGSNPKTPPVDVRYFPPGDGETGPGRLVIEILSKQGDGQHCAFSTSRYYEGFFLYTD